MPTLLTALDRKLSNSKDRYVAEAFDTIEGAFTEQKSDIERWQPLKKLAGLCDILSYSLRAGDNDFNRPYRYQNKDGGPLPPFQRVAQSQWLLQPFGLEEKSFVAGRGTLPIKRQDANKELSGKNARRIHDLTEAAIAQGSMKNLVPWEPILAISHAVPKVSHLWRECPEKFNLFSCDDIAEISALNMAHILAKPKAVGDFYIGGVKKDDTQSAQDVPIAQQRDNGDLYYFFGQFHGNEEWVSNQYRYAARLGGEREQQKQQQFNDFRGKAKHYFHVRHVAKGQYDIELL